MPTTVTVLGSCGGFPEPGRACAGFLVSLDGFHLLLDVGYGALRVLLESLPSGAVDAIIVTHSHPDHCADLHPLFRLHHYGGTGHRIPLYSPGGVLNRLTSLEPDVDLSSVFDECSLADTQTIGPFEVKSWMLPHFVPNAGVRVTAPGLVLAYTGDCGPVPELADLGRDADLFIVDATDRPGETEQTERNLMTAREAGIAAQQAGARTLLLTHIWPGNYRAKAVAEALEVYGGEVKAADEGMRLSI